MAKPVVLSDGGELLTDSGDAVPSSAFTNIDAIAAEVAVNPALTDAFVADTGNQTIAGIKTFTSDPLIPDEAYDATAWNGVLEPPTKNAVRDKVETLAAITYVDGKVTQTITNGVTTTAPSEDAVFDALALKAPATDVSTMWIGAAAMETTMGSPATSNVGSANEGLTPVKLLDAATIEGVTGDIWLPASWVTWKITVHWTNGGAGAGDVVFLACYKDQVDGATMNGTQSGTTTVTAPAQNVIETTQLVTGIARGTGPTLVSVWRVGDNVADTLANDAALIGVLLEKVS